MLDLEWPIMYPCVFYMLLYVKALKCHACLFTAFLNCHYVCHEFTTIMHEPFSKISVVVVDTEFCTLYDSSPPSPMMLEL